MKAIFIIILTVVILGGTFTGYWFFVLKESSLTKNTDQMPNNISIKNQVLNSNVSESIPMPEPLNSWNQNYQPISPELQTRPANVSEGLLVCNKDNICLTELAVGFRDARVCEQLDISTKTIGLTTSEEDIMHCFEEFGREYGPYDCSIHQDEQIRNICYFVFSSSSFVENPINGCSRITDSSIRANCQEAKQLSENINATMTQQLSLTKRLSLSECYINQHPDILNQMPQNELTREFYGDAVSPMFVAAGCNEFSSEEIESIREMLLTDTDRDGVVLIIEEIYQSSDTSADTDGDRYPDLEEILNGYNPNGPGKL